MACYIDQRGLPIALHTLGVNVRRWHPIRLPSVKASRCFEDGELDFVFIDGEHSYEAAKADIEAWWPKVRSGGLLMGHDYDRQRFAGVCRAVDEFGREHAVEVGRRGHSVWVCAKRTRIAEQVLFDLQSIFLRKTWAAPNSCLSPIPLQIPLQLCMSPTEMLV